MSPSLDAARARQYLLGEATDEERVAIELEYFRDDEMVESIVAAEDDLIEDYLADQLTAAERRVFERGYLATPDHQHRVEMVRQLMAVASRPQPGHLPGEPARSPAPATRWRFERRWLAVAALVTVAAGSAWVIGGRDRALRVTQDTPPVASIPPAPPIVAVPPPAPPPAVRMFAVSLSPVAVRSTSATPAVIVPKGTDVVVVNLEGEGAPIVRGRGSIRTVSGDSIWDGPATPPPNGPSGIVARLDVPSARLPADDYIVTLHVTDGNGAEHERARYFLRVRER